MIALSKRIARAFRREDGTATIEFVMAVPVLLTVFMASFESGLLMVRSIMLDQATDMTMRELRLGHIPLPTSAILKKEICKRTTIIRDCEANIMIELNRISKTSWAFPSNNVACIDRDEEILPVVNYIVPTQNDLMLVRVCVVQDALFPTTGVGLALPKDGKDGYAVVATSAFSAEPE